jgi:hypothetical protein
MQLADMPHLSQSGRVLGSQTRIGILMGIGTAGVGSRHQLWYRGTTGFETASRQDSSGRTGARPATPAHLYAAVCCDTRVYTNGATQQGAYSVTGLRYELLLPFKSAIISIYVKQHRMS